MRLRFVSGLGPASLRSTAPSASMPAVGCGGGKPSRVKEPLQEPPDWPKPPQRIGEAAVSSAELGPLPVAGGGAALISHGDVGCPLCPLRILRITNCKVFFWKYANFAVCGVVWSHFKSKCANHCYHFLSSSPHLFPSASSAWLILFHYYILFLLNTVIISYFSQTVIGTLPHKDDIVLKWLLPTCCSEDGNGRVEKWSRNKKKKKEERNLLTD